MAPDLFVIGSELDCSFVGCIAGPLVSVPTGLGEVEVVAGMGTEDVDGFIIGGCEKLLSLFKEGTMVLGRMVGVLTVGVVDNDDE